MQNLKLVRARTALHFLNQAIVAMESGRKPSNPDYDLWRAHAELTEVLAMDNDVQDYHDQ
jgi:hypothetical protein